METMYIFLYSLSMVIAVCMSETAEDCGRDQVVSDMKMNSIIAFKKDVKINLLHESNNVSREFCLRHCCHMDECNIISFNQDADEDDHNCFLYSCVPLSNCSFDKEEDFISFSISRQNVIEMSTISTSVPSDTEIIQKEIDTFAESEQNQGVVSDHVIEVFNNTDIVNLATTESTSTKATTTSLKPTSSTKASVQKTVDKSTINLALKSTKAVPDTLSSSTILSSASNTSNRTVIRTTTSSKSTNPIIHQTSVKSASSGKVNKASSVPSSPKMKSSSNSLTSPMKSVTSKTGAPIATTLKSMSKSTINAMTKSASNNISQSTSDLGEEKISTVQSLTKGISKSNHTESKSDASDSSRSDKGTLSTHPTSKISNKPLSSTTTTTISPRIPEKPVQTSVKPKSAKPTDISKITDTTLQNITKAKTVLQTTVVEQTTQATHATTGKTINSQTTAKAVLESTTKKQVTEGTTLKKTTTPTKSTTERAGAGKSNGTSKMKDFKNVNDSTKAKGDQNITYADSNQLLKEKNESHVLSGALIATLSFGILFFFAVLVLIGKRCFDSWQRRHYSRVDYLVNGMYN